MVAALYGGCLVSSARSRSVLSGVVAACVLTACATGGTHEGSGGAIRCGLVAGELVAIAIDEPARGDTMVEFQPRRVEGSAYAQDRVWSREGKGLEVFDLRFLRHGVLNSFGTTSIQLGAGEVRLRSSDRHPTIRMVEVARYTDVPIYASEDSGSRSHFVYVQVRPRCNFQAYWEASELRAFGAVGLGPIQSFSVVKTGAGS